MADYELRAQIVDLERSLGAIEAVLKPEQINAEIQRLEELASDPDLWSDQERAQQVTGDLSRLKAQASKVGSLRRGLDDLEVLLDLAGEESSDSALKEVEAEAETAQSKAQS
jgi:peptide chain release factor 2